LALEIQRRLRLLERWVDAYVAPSAFVARMLVRAGYPAERIHVIHYGVPLPSQAVSGGTHALYAGRLTPEKGISTLVEAVRANAGIPIILAGQGPLASQVRTVASSNVRYVGRVSPDEVTELLRGAAFAVVPSTWADNLPFAAIEPLAAGVPVVASRAGGLPEIVEDGVNGLLVPPGDAPALANAMRTLWYDVDLRARLGCAARRIAAGRFSLVGQTQQLLDLYDRLRSTR
jgi:glycosyltransferase involved in cell wall biosynthesis